MAKTTKKTGIDEVEITATCIQCGKSQVLTSQQILDAEIGGSLTSTCCYFPMYVNKVKAKFAKK